MVGSLSIVCLCLCVYRSASQGKIVYEKSMGYMEARKETRRSKHKPTADSSTLRLAASDSSEPSNKVNQRNIRDQREYQKDTPVPPLLTIIIVHGSRILRSGGVRTVTAIRGSIRVDQVPSAARQVIGSIRRTSLSSRRVKASKVICRAIDRNRFEKVTHTTAEEPAEWVQPIQPIAVEIVQCGVRNERTVEDHEDVPEEGRGKTAGLHVGEHGCEQEVPSKSKDTAGDELEVLVAGDGAFVGIAYRPVHAEVDEGEADNHVGYLNR